VLPVGPGDFLAAPVFQQAAVGQAGEGIVEEAHGKGLLARRVANEYVGKEHHVKAPGFLGGGEGTGDNPAAHPAAVLAAQLALVEPAPIPVHVRHDPFHGLFPVASGDEAGGGKPQELFPVVAREALGVTVGKADQAVFIHPDNAQGEFFHAGGNAPVFGAFRVCGAQGGFRPLARTALTDQFHPVGHVEFAENAPGVGAHGPEADAQPFRDLLVGMAPGHEFVHRPFPFREGTNPVPQARVPVLLAAPMDGLQIADVEAQGVGLDGLFHIEIGAGTQGFHPPGLVQQAGNDHNGHAVAQAVAADVADYRIAGLALGQHQIHHCQMPVFRFHLGHGLFRRGGQHRLVTQVGQDALEKLGLGLVVLHQQGPLHGRRGEAGFVLPGDAQVKAEIFQVVLVEHLGDAVLHGLFRHFRGAGGEQHDGNLLLVFSAPDLVHQILIAFRPDQGGADHHVAGVMVQMGQSLLHGNATVGAPPLVLGSLGDDGTEGGGGIDVKQTGGGMAHDNSQVRVNLTIIMAFLGRRMFG